MALNTHHKTTISQIMAELKTRTEGMKPADKKKYLESFVDKISSGDADELQKKADADFEAFEAARKLYEGNKLIAGIFKDVSRLAADDQAEYKGILAKDAAELAKAK